MNLNEALKELSENGYMVESKQYDIGTIIDTVFKDEEFKPTNDKNEFIGTPMSEYDVDVHYRYEPSSDTLYVTFNYGDDELVFDQFTKNVKIKKVKGWWEDSLKAEITPQLEKFIEDVTWKWQDCFSI